MNPSDEAALEAVADAFADCPRQQLIRDPSHCAECADADRYLTSLDRSDLALADVSTGVGLDYFSMITDEGFRHFIPALCRIALQERPAGLGHLLFRLGRAHTIITDTRQRAALAEFLGYITAMRYIDADYERRDMREIRERLREKPENA